MEDSRDFILPSVIFGDEAPILEHGAVKTLAGVGTSSGIYHGRTTIVRVIADFDSVSDGDVVVIPFADVSWTPILVKAGAIVSESGGMLSHCSIIARELGIPALVSVDNACSLLAGKEVTVDGSNGIVTVHDYE
jgi:phosphoenolpyruvate synthase/pyruvate phosphate dikinase